jgi:hypothetical protein
VSSTATPAGGGRHIDEDVPVRRIAGFTPRRLVVLVLICAVAALFVAWLSWIGVRLTDAKNHLESAQKRVVVLQKHLLDGDAKAAEADVRAIRHDTHEARSATHGLAVRSAASIPYLGRTPHAARSLSDVAVGIADGPLSRLVTAGLAFSPNRLRTSGDTIDVRGLQAAAAPLRTAVTELDSYTRRLGTVPTGSLVLDPIEHARAALTGNIAQVRATAVVANRFASIAPAMLGANGTRRYFVADVNVNEARGTGGVLGGYQILEATKGRIRVVSSGAASDLSQAQAWRDANFGPDFADAASTWASLWERTHKSQRIDGVLSLSPLALSQIVAATGPVQLERGAPLNSGNVVFRVTQRYASAKTAKQRDGVLPLVTERIISYVLRGAGESRNLATRLGKASGHGHVLLWSSRPEEERVLAQAPIAGALSSAPGPYVGLIVNNIGGTKVDTFLRRSVTYFADGCGSSRRNTSIAVRLSSEASGDLAPYLTQRTDKPAKGTPAGQSRYEISLYTTAGAQLRSATLDGAAVTLKQVSDGNRRVFVIDATVERRGTRVLTVQLSEPSAPGVPTIAVQPLLRPQQSVVDAPVCGPR